MHTYVFLYVHTYIYTYIYIYIFPGAPISNFFRSCQPGGARFGDASLGSAVEGTARCCGGKGIAFRDGAKPAVGCCGKAGVASGFGDGAAQPALSAVPSVSRRSPNAQTEVVVSR